MRILLYILILIISLSTSLISAQDFKGIATYKSQRKMDIQLDSTQMNEEMRSRMMAMLKKQFEKEYTLKFNNHESIYKEVENLKKPSGVSSGGMQVVVMTAGGSDILYKNNNENRYVNQNELFGKIFLIQDSLEDVDWSLEKETKNIGEYTCFKATFKRMVRKPKMKVKIDSEDSKESEEEEKEVEEEEVEQIVTAWYTLQIPVKYGPGAYGGLPGLILEINAGTETILCSKIILNPKGGININEPVKGKKVNQKEFDEILDKKMKERESQYDSRRKGEVHSIKING